MSGETLVVGSLNFRDGTSEKSKMRVLESLADALEIEVSELHYNIYSGSWSFQSINWQSNVEKETIENFLKNWKGYIQRFVCSLHYLTDPEEVNYREEPRKNKSQEAV